MKLPYVENHGRLLLYATPTAYCCPALPTFCTRPNRCRRRFNRRYNTAAMGAARARYSSCWLTKTKLIYCDSSLLSYPRSHDGVGRSCSGCTAWYGMRASGSNQSGGSVYLRAEMRCWARHTDRHTTDANNKHTQRAVTPCHTDYPQAHHHDVYHAAATPRRMPHRGQDRCVPRTGRFFPVPAHAFDTCSCRKVQLCLRSPKVPLGGLHHGGGER